MIALAIQYLLAFFTVTTLVCLLLIAALATVLYAGVVAISERLWRKR